MILKKFFPADDRDADYFYAHRDKFEYDNNFILVAIENKKGIFDISFMNEVKSLTTKLQTSLPFITGVRSITNQNEVSLFGINNSVERPYVDLQKWKEDSSFITKDSARIYSSKELLNTLVARDGKSVSIFLKHEDGLSVKKSDTLVAELKGILSDFQFDSVHLAGTTVGQRLYIEKMNSELLFFYGTQRYFSHTFSFHCLSFRLGYFGATGSDFCIYVMGDRRDGTF